MLFKSSLTAVALVCSLLMPVPSVAQTSLDEVVEAEILPGWTTRSGTRMAALRLTLAPGWKTYWRAPGDAGIPPMFTWDGSSNLRSVQTHWPRPSVFTSAGLRTVGYERELILPLEFKPTRKGAPISISGEVQLGVCETICVPVSLNFAAELEGKGASDPDIHAALASQPVEGSRAGVQSATCSFAPISDGLRLTAQLQMPKIGRTEVAVVEAGDLRIWVSEAEVTRSGDILTVEADLVPPRGTPAAVDRKDLRFTILGKRQAVDVRGCTAG